jgi:hypothetical protein
MALCHNDVIPNRKQNCTYGFGLSMCMAIGIQSIPAKNSNSNSLKCLSCGDGALACSTNLPRVLQRTLQMSEAIHLVQLPPRAFPSHMGLSCVREILL